jgi:nitroreductase
MTNFIDNLNWRFAAKEFAADSAVSEENLKGIIEAIHLCPTSYGLQPYHIYVVSNPETKEKLQEAGFNQPQFSTASHILVFCARTDVKERVDIFADAATGGDSEKREKMKGFLDMMYGFAENTTGEKAENWASRQAYIALGFAMAAAAELQVDSCPMEGFSKEEFDEILQMPTHIKSEVVLALGQRTADPKRPKFRYPEEDLFTFQ